MIAGLSGGLYAFHEGYVGPGQLGPVCPRRSSCTCCSAAWARWSAPVLGVGIIDLFSYLLSQQWETGWPIVLGLLLLVVVMFRPTGLIGFLVSERERVGSFGRRDATRKPDAPATRPRGSAP